MTEESKHFASRLFARFPWLAAHATTERSSGASPGDLLVQVPSPTGDEGRSLTIWWEEGEPSVGFGWWHTHATTCDPPEHGDEWDGILDVIKAILADDFVLTEDVGGDWEGRLGVLDLRETDDLANELRDEWSPRQLQLKSWTGKADKLIQSDGID